MSLATEAAIETLKARGLRPETLELFGITPEPEKEAWRFPIRTLHGATVGDKYKSWHSAQQKYWWGEGQRLPIYGLDVLSSQFPGTSVVYLVEGEADLWVAYQAGIPALSITRGANYVPPGIEALLESIGIEVVYILYDNDKAGRNGASALLRAFSNLPATIVTLPGEVGEGGDLTDLYRIAEHDDTKLRKLVGALPEYTPETKPPRTQTATELTAKLEPLPPWLARGLLRAGELAILSGRHDSYKSWFVLELALAIASGTQFLGCIPGDIKGKVLLVQEEISPLFFSHRVAAVTSGMSKATTDNLLIWNRQGLVVDERHDSLKDLFNVVSTEEPLLLIVDNLSCVYPPSFGENDSSAMTDFFVPFKEIRDSGCAVLLVHHDRKPGAMEGMDSPRGSSVLENAPDVRIRLLRDPNNREWVECRTRMRNSPGMPPFKMFFDPDSQRLSWSAYNG